MWIDLSAKYKTFSFFFVPILLKYQNWETVEFDNNAFFFVLCLGCPSITCHKLGNIIQVSVTKSTSIYGKKSMSMIMI